MERITERIADSEAHPLMDESALSLQELEKTVWKKDACSSCRACISICPAGALAYNHGRNQPYQVGPCVDCKACLDVCPRLPANSQKIISSQIIGHYIAIKNAGPR